MKKFLILVPVAVLLTACGTTDPYEKRSESERVRNEKYVERTIDKAPKWMEKLPESKSAAYANGTGVSTDFSMADEEAKLHAFSKICMTAGGEVDKQSKMFTSDTNDTSVKTKELAIRAKCKETDISGVEIVEVKRISEGTRYRSYMLIALPLGEANLVQQRNDQRKAAAGAKAQADRAFTELDANNQR